MAETPEETIADLAGDDPEGVISLFASVIPEDADSEDVVVLAVAFAKEGVNVFRLMQDHPKATEQAFGNTYEIGQSMIERMDAVIESEN